MATQQLKQSDKKSFLMTPVGIVVIFIVGIILGAGIFAVVWQMYAPLSFEANSSLSSERVVELPSASSTEVSPTSTESQVGSLGLSESVEKAYVEALQRDVPGGERVAWSRAVEIQRSSWKKIFGGIIPPERLQELVIYTTSSYPTDRGEVGIYAGEYVGIDRVWEIGTVQGGPFQEGKVYHIRLFGSYPFANNEFDVVVSDNGTSNALVQYPASEAMTQQIEAVGIKTDTTIRLNGFALPERLSVRGGTYARMPQHRSFAVFASDENVLQDLTYVATSDEGIQLYAFSNNSETDWWDWKAGCLYVLLPNATYVSYGSFIPSFLNHGSGIGTDSWSIPTDPGISWVSEYENQNQYESFVVTGCGREFCPKLLSEAPETFEKRIVQVGTVSETGERVYAFKDPANEDMIKSIYDGWYTPEGDKPTFAEMQSRFRVPVFFWKDSLGRWMVYTVTDLIPLAECGKPVIYLYPESTTDVRVALPSFIHVTVSEPTYPTNGWLATAQPNGDLTVSGASYGSLYWEGTGVSYNAPKTGFVVKDGDVSAFFDRILPVYGLNEKESREFKEFWIEKLVGASYYRISFLTDDWSEAAPLYVTPRPKTSIRLFMDWAPLSAPITITEPTIVTPRRDGFTLVEWGGLLYE